MTNQQTRPAQKPMAKGRSAQIFPWESSTVIKLFFDTIPEEEVDREYQNALEAYSRGASAMACHGKIRHNGRAGIILERVDGISLTRTPEKNPLSFFSLPRTLAALHISLHKTRTHAMTDVRTLASDMLDGSPLSFLTEREKNRAREIIQALPGGDAILHMDFHPENVLVTGQTCTLIDWMTAARGVPAADVASTVFLLRDAELFPGISVLKKSFYEVVRRFILGRYLKAYLNKTSLTMAEIRAWRLPVLLLRLGLWDIESERNRLKNEISDLLKGDLK